MLAGGRDDQSAAGVDVVETHISWVFLVGEQAYKLKKPLRLAFLDYATPARRRTMCEREVALNRRLAPEIYAGVRSLVRDGGRLALGEADDERAVDYLVEMRRFDEHLTLASQLTAGELAPEEIAAVGRLLADFHLQAPITRMPAREVAARTRREFGANIEELLELLQASQPRARLLAPDRSLNALLDARLGEIIARGLTGYVRRGHGDLRAEHVILGWCPAIVDCIEFDDRLAEIDVVDDLSFLIMDLTARGAPATAKSLVNAYHAAGGNPGDDSLTALYGAHRALVRTKVALLRAGELPEAGRDRTVARDEALHLLQLAERFTWQARLPLALVICGTPASGKSHLASCLAQRSGLPSLNSDAIRKQVIGIAPTAPASLEHYAADQNEATYSALGAAARAEVERGGGVLVDATFRHREDRAAFRRGFEEAPPLAFVECRVPLDVAVARAEQRRRGGPRVSDADEAVARREHEAWDELDQILPRRHQIVRADRPAEAIVADVIAVLDARLPNASTSVAG